MWGLANVTFDGTCKESRGGVGKLISQKTVKGEEGNKKCSTGIYFSEKYVH